MSKRKSLVWLAALLLPVCVFAGTTGKIKGKVADRESKEALPGANVLIVGTTIGAATNVNGEFVLLNIPPGVYEVRAQYIGYREVSISNVRVSADLTTEVDFNLPSEALEVGEVVIVAERPLVNTNATNATRIQSYEDFKNIPVRTVNAVIALQPGVVVQNGQLFVRGGRNDEVGFYLEGANTRDADNGVNVVTVIPEALEEFQLQAGGYNAEFGGANAGIVRQTLKSGGNRFRFSLQGETDNFASRGETFLGTHSYGVTDFTGTLSGPLLSNKLKFFVAAQNIFQRDRTTRFWEGFNIQHADSYVDDSHFPLVLSNFHDPEVEAMIQERGLKMDENAIPAASFNQWIGNGTLVFDAKPFIVRLGGSVTWQRQDDILSIGNPAGSISSRLFNLDRTQHEDLSTGLLNLKVTHLLSAKSFYEINFNYFDRRQVQYDPIFQHNYWAYWDSIANAQQGIDFYSYAGAAPWLGASQAMLMYGFEFVAPGTPYGYTKNKRGYWGGSAAFNTQYRNHELKFGGSYERWTARQYAADNGWARTQLQAAWQNPDTYRAALNGDPAAESSFRALSGAAQYLTYGYDVFGNESNVDGPDGTRNPYYMSFYAQDKFEAKDVVINAGLRLDIIDNDDFIFADPTNPPWDRANQGLFTDQLIKKEAAVELSPRLGLAFPVTDRTVFHLQYGKFVQAPRLTDVYNGSSWYDALFGGGTSFRTNVVGMGLNPQ